MCLPDVPSPTLRSQRPPFSVSLPPLSASWERQFLIRCRNIASRSARYTCAQELLDVERNALLNELVKLRTEAQAAIHRSSWLPWRRTKEDFYSSSALLVFLIST